MSFQSPIITAKSDAIKFALLVLSLLIFVSCKNEINNNRKGLILSEDNTRYFDETEMKWKYLLKKGENIDSLKIKVNKLNQKGTDLRDISQYKDALKIHFDALQLAEEVSDTSGIIISLNNIGTDLRRTSSNIEASDYHYKALELAKNNPNFSKSKAVAMNGLGNIFLSLNKPDEAKEYFKSSLDIEKNLKSPLGQAINYANLGTAYEQQGKLDNALNYYYKSIGQNFKIDSKIGLAICKNAIGNIFIKKGKTDEGLALIKESVNLLEGSDDIFHKMQMQISLCETYIKQKQYENAEMILEQIFEDPQNLSSFGEKNLVYQLLSDLKKNQGDYQSAYEAREKSIAYRDSTLILNNEMKVLELENRYKNKQAIEQIKNLTLQKELLQKTKNNQKWIFLTFMASLLFALGFVYNQYKSRTKISNELKKLNEMKLRFFGNISHELRTPLTLIKGPLDDILQKTQDENIKSDALLMKRNSDRLTHLVEQILSLSKIDAGKFEIKAMQADLKDELNGIAQSFEYMFLEKNIHFDIDLEESGLVWYDREIVEIVLTNLLSNAYKYTPESGNIVLKGNLVNNQYPISVQNTSEPITEKNLNVFLERFYSSATHVQQGIGIGLSLVKELCLLYNAKLNINKLSETQLEFTIYLPIEKSNFNQFIEIAKVSKKNEPEPIEISEISFNVNDKPLLLIVEDNEDMRQYIKSIFKENYKVETAKNGLEGVQMAQNSLPDLIISDVMMPEMNGFELCEKLKSETLTNHIPILLLTALSDEEHIVTGLEKSADDYIAKPFSAKVLKAKVNNLIHLRETLLTKYRAEIMIKPFDLVLKGGNRDFKEVLKNVIETQLTNPQFGVDAFCDLVAMSRTQLHRKLIATTGFSVTEFIKIHRLKMAAELLKDPNATISEVCYASGFNDTSYFSKQFKSMFGLSPLHYKENKTAF